MLREHISTKAHIGQHIKPFNIASNILLRSRKNHPSHTETTDTVRLRKTVHRYTEDVWCKTSNSNMLLTIHHQAVINLIRKDNQVILACNIDNLLKNILRIEMASVFGSMSLFTVRGRRSKNGRHM